VTYSLYSPVQSVNLMSVFRTLRTRHLLHVSAFWPSSGRFHNIIYGKVHRGGGGLLFTVNILKYKTSDCYCL